LKDVIEVNISTPNRGNGALQEIGAKAGHLPKTLENTRKILDVALDGSHKHDRIVRIEGGVQDSPVPMKLVK
jgi:hypothetical protein